jgi:hypothetical protein
MEIGRCFSACYGFSGISCNEEANLMSNTISFGATKAWISNGYFPSTTAFENDGMKNE